MPTLTTTAASFSGGSAPIAAVPANDLVSVTGVWDTADEFSIVLTNVISGVQTLIGAGNVSGLNPSPTYCFTFNQKVNLLASASVYTSALGKPSTFNDLNTSGNGFVTLSDWWNTPNTLVAASPFQNNLAFFSRFAVQVWQVSADIAQWAQVQVLPNTGTIAAKSVQSLGDLDVLYLSDTGLRSLRARETTLNAFITDIGSAIDTLVKASIATAGGGVGASVGIVEPVSGRYWCYVGGTIYVLSYYPSNKIIAWGTYLPTYSNAGVQTTFVPTDMVVYQGLVYLRSGGQVFIYGDTNGATYDNCVATAATTWLDMKTPGSVKLFRSIDVAITGDWVVQAGTDQLNESLNTVIDTTTATYLLGEVPVTGEGTHFKISASTAAGSAVAAKLSAVMFHYNQEHEK